MSRGFENLVRALQNDPEARRLWREASFEQKYATVLYTDVFEREEDD